MELNEFIIERAEERGRNVSLELSGWESVVFRLDDDATG